MANDLAGVAVTAERLSDGPVAICDRRELPFFQVRVRAVQAIRDQTSGPRRLRAIGFYALLCQLANEQRHTGGQRVVRFTYDELAARGQMSKRSVKLLLGVLERAEVVGYERQNDGGTGAVVSLLHLLIHDDPWIALTVGMAAQLAQSRPGGHLLRDLGLVVVLLEFCIEQRVQHGGLAAEVMRGDVSARSGLTVDGVDDCNRALERAGVLRIARRRAANGGRYLPSVYTISEAPSTPLQGGETVPATRRNGYWQGGETVPATRQTGTGKAADRYSQGGDSATVSSVSPPSIARAGKDVEQGGIENDIPPLADSRPSRATDGGAERASSEEEDQEELCEALLSAWKPALGDNPRREYEMHRKRWLEAAARVLERHPRDRLSEALAYMVTDEILGSRALTMTGFANVADQLIARAYARRLRTEPNRMRPRAAGAPAWEEARQALQRAIQRHGRDGRRQALEELAAQSALLVRFVERVRWGSLCEQPFQYVERRYAELWGELVEQTNEPAEEPG